MRIYLITGGLAPVTPLGPSGRSPRLEAPYDFSKAWLLIIVDQMPFHTWLLIAQVATAVPLPLDPAAVVSEPRYEPNEDVWIVSIHNSSFSPQSRLPHHGMHLQVLLPDSVNASESLRQVGARLPLLLVLPVEANLPRGNDEPKQDAGRYGNGLLEIQKANFHNRAQHIVATMEFHDTPWFADNTKEPATSWLGNLEGDLPEGTEARSLGNRARHVSSRKAAKYQPEACYL